tara:strand:+ start:357 stop:605 length:249 start_codon:yes stop_codon:yes gene_type:complete
MSDSIKKNIDKPKSEFGRLMLAANMPLMVTAAVLAQYTPRFESQITEFYDKVAKEVINKQIQGADSLGQFLKLDDKTLDEQL